ncbi:MULTISPECIES: hypothetical protein [unclassified Microcoleus]|uniref:hypothetical protein n=1 Tax=unclassified Microcoleus TaxID=2642155 RepID=UPI002FD4BA95
MKKKVIMTHIHARITKLAKGAIERGDILSCDRISDGSYLIKRSVPDTNDGKPQTTKYTTVAAASLLYLLNSYALANPTSETVAETETETV